MSPRRACRLKVFLFLLNEVWVGTGESVRNSTDSVLPEPTFSGGRELMEPFSNCCSSLKPETTVTRRIQFFQYRHFLAVENYWGC